MATSTYCKGVKTKNTQNNARWSATRVGVSVMNSRNAQNDKQPNTTAVAIGPKQKAAASTAHSSHQARNRRLNRSTTAGSGPASASRFKSWPTPVAAPNRSSTAPTNRNVVGSIMRSLLFQLPYGLTGTLQKIGFRLSRLQPH